MPAPLDLNRTKLTLDEGRPYLFGIIDLTKICLDTPASGGGPFYPTTIVMDQQAVAERIVRLWNDDVDRLNKENSNA